MTTNNDGNGSGEGNQAQNDGVEGSNGASNDSTLQAQIDTFNARNTELTTQNGELAAQLKDKDTQVSGLEKDLQVFKTDLDKLQESVTEGAEYKGKFDTLNTEHTQLQETHNALLEVQILDIKTRLTAFGIPEEKSKDKNLQQLQLMEETIMSASGKSNADMLGLRGGSSNTNNIGNMTPLELSTLEVNKWTS